MRPEDPKREARRGSWGGVILVLFEPPRTRVETTMFSLKTNNSEAYLLSLAGYGTCVNVLTLHNLLNVQKLSKCYEIGLAADICRFNICLSRSLTYNIQRSKHEQIYGKSSKVIDLEAHAIPISH